ncbi:MAG: hypothetical protein ACRC30_03855 [Clostridium sp.]
MKKKIAMVGIGIGIILLIISFILPVTSMYISKPHEYVGGDAYNYIIEGALRGGKMAGGMIRNALYFSTGLILTFISTFKLLEDNKKSELEC